MAKVVAANLSIHPRVWRGGEKSNTFAAKNPDTLRRAIAGTSEHLERHPTDGTAARRVASFEKRLNGRVAS